MRRSMVAEASRTRETARVARQSVSAAPLPQAAEPRRAGLERRVGLLARAKFGLVRWFLWAWVRAFSLRGLFYLGQYFGTAEYLINFKRRARCRRELRRIFPEGLPRGRARQIVLRFFRRTRCDKLFYLIFDLLPREKILRRIRFHGREHLDEGLARGRGVYVMLSHHGSHHVAGLLMALLGYRCAGVRDPNEGALRVYTQQKYAETFPEFAAIRLLYSDGFPREIYRCFQENRVVGTALDVGRIRGVTLKTCPVEIFGQKREFLTGTLQIALRSRATIVQGFVVSRRNFYFQLVVRPLYIPDQAGVDGRPGLIAELMQKYADGIAAHVREHPDHLSRI
jgi:lauroyl/myristoyl acyltransferase